MRVVAAGLSQRAGLVLAPSPAPPPHAREGREGVRSDGLLESFRFVCRIKPFPERLRIRCMLAAIADKRHAVRDRAKELERPDPALEEAHDFLLIAPAVPHRRRNDVDMVRKFRADFLSPFFTVQTAHCFSPARLEQPYGLGLFCVSSAHLGPGEGGPSSGPRARLRPQ